MWRRIVMSKRIYFVPTGVAVASGLAATMTIVHMLKAGDGIVCMNDVYGGEPCLLI